MKNYAPAELEAGRLLFSSPARFVLGATNLDQLPSEAAVEIAFAGRSNVGKSSLINALTGRRDLARHSRTPGRTRELNYFRIGDDLALVDMPGYGYARAERKRVSAWQRLIGSYLAARRGLRRVFLLIDARHGVTAPDRAIMTLLDEKGVNYQIVLTKADKLSARERIEAADAVQKVTARRSAAHPVVHVTSAAKRSGIDELRAEIAGLAGR
jgi:GTP-binding protein